jgi:hypothetical protein
MFGLGEIGEAFAEFEDGGTSPWDTRGIPDNETHFVIRTTVKRNTVYWTMKHCLPDNETPFGAQLPDNETSFSVATA